MRALVLLLALAGCNDLLGISTVRGRPDGAPDATVDAKPDAMIPPDAKMCTSNNQCPGSFCDTTTHTCH